MNIRLLTILFITFTSLPFLAAENVSVDYDYLGNHNTDFSNIRFSLSVGEFTDGRNTGDPKFITEEYLGETSLANIVRGALIQGFEHGGAELVTEGGEMKIVGSIISSEVQIVDRNGVESLQLTIRSNVQLQGRGRTIWETILFGRGVVPVNDGIVAAVHRSMDRMIRELVNDDYFLIELQ